MPATGEPPGDVVGEPDGLRREPETASTGDGQRTPRHVAEPRHPRPPGQPGGERRVRRRNLEPDEVGAVDRSPEDWRVQPSDRARVAKEPRDAVERRRADDLNAFINRKGC